jgi:polyferredoxin/Flp pilus assembly protein TadD
MAVHLPVLEAGARYAPRRSRAARWRTASLIIVHLLMAAHILHWAVTGRSFSRVVLSDSMRTFELGEINPGFIFFAAALLITVLFGRFMCGWVCHMGALQDLCAWLLRRMRIHPRLFRSRLLGFVPLGLAAYMFIWPTFEREAVRPAMRWAGADAPAAAEFPGFSLDFTTQNLWDGLPSLGVAIPFLVVCGVATVYFLGARGLCRYGCPYGGFLLPAERVAPWRVVVEPARCDQCGLCTAACTAGVRVHDEVRRFGDVRDSNCIRSLDCVSICPGGALSFSSRRAEPMVAGEPPPRAKHDLTALEEVVLLAVFLATFFVTRGLYDRVPMLLAVSLGVLAAFVAWKAWRLATTANVRLGPMVLRQRERVRREGWAFVAATAGAALLLAHSAAVKASLWRADVQARAVTIPFADVLAGAVPPQAQREASRAAAVWYSRALPLSAGGFALAESPDARTRLAWMHLVLGEHAEAIGHLQARLHAGSATDAVVVSLAHLRSLEQGWEAYEETLRDALARHPSYADTRDALAAGLLRRGRTDEAMTLYRDRLARRPHDARARAGLGHLLIAGGRVEQGLSELRAAAAEQPRNSDLRAGFAAALAASGRLDEALTELNSAARARPAARRELSGLGAAWLERAGRAAEADEWRTRAGA